MTMTPKQINTLIQESKTDKQPYTRVWEMVGKYVEGKQSLIFDKSTQKFQKNSKNRNKVTINRLLGILRTVVAKLQIVYPSVGVLPASPSSEDISKAELSEEAIQFNFHNDKLKQTVEAHILELCEYGTAAFHTYYDASTDRAHTATVSPYDLFVEQGATSLEESRFVSVRSFVSRDKLTEAYPSHTEAIKEYSEADTNASGRDKQLKDRVEIHEVYTDDGFHYILLGELVLFKGEWKGIHPIQVTRYTTLPGRFWGVGLIEPLLELQNLYNQARTQVIRNVELMSNPKWLIPKTAGVSADSIKGSPGEKVYFNPAGGIPQMLPAAPMPSYVFDNIQRLQSEIQDVAGIHNISMGKRTVGISSGKAIEALAAQDVGQLQITQGSIESSLQNVFTRILEIMKTHYTESRMVAMFDSRGKAVFKELKGTDLVDAPDVFINASSLFQDTKETRDQKVLELFQLQLIDKDEALKQLTFKTGITAGLEKASAISHAREILAALIRGMEVEIMANDDIGAFIQVFGEFIRSSDYYELNEETQDEIADVLNALLTPNDDAALQALGGRPVIYPRVAMPLPPQVDSTPASAPVTESKPVLNNNQMLQAQGIAEGQGEEV